jgi:hypothetical protein
MSRTCPEPNTGCYLWTGASNSGGYGVIIVGGKSHGVHRLVWSLVNEVDAPDGWYVCHKCDTPACCNPDHLFLGTPSDNNRDAIAKGRRISQVDRMIMILDSIESKRKWLNSSKVNS